MRRLKRGRENKLRKLIKFHLYRNGDNAVRIAI